jgi:hypothetical protein
MKDPNGKAMSSPSDPVGGNAFTVHFTIWPRSRARTKIRYIVKSPARFAESAPSYVHTIELLDLGLQHEQLDARRNDARACNLGQWFFSISDDTEQPLDTIASNWRNDTGLGQNSWTAVIRGREWLVLTSKGQPPTPFVHLTVKPQIAGQFATA